MKKKERTTTLLEVAYEGNSGHDFGHRDLELLKARYF
jgi:hypothetical protein